MRELGVAQISTSMVTSLSGEISRKTWQARWSFRILEEQIHALLFLFKHAGCCIGENFARFDSLGGLLRLLTCSWKFDMLPLQFHIDCE
jgi:hypothetical protein